MEREAWISKFHQERTHAQCFMISCLMLERKRFEAKLEERKRFEAKLEESKKTFEIFCVVHTYREVRGLLIIFCKSLVVDH